MKLLIITFAAPAVPPPLPTDAAKKEEAGEKLATRVGNTSIPVTLKG